MMSETLFGMFLFYIYFTWIFFLGIKIKDSGDENWELSDYIIVLIAPMVFPYALGALATKIWSWEK